MHIYICTCVDPFFSWPRSTIFLFVTIIMAEIAAAKKARQAVVAQLAELGGQKKKAAAK